MSKKSERRRASALQIDPLVYRREAPKGSIEVSMLGNIQYREKTIIVGRLMLSDSTGKISRLGVFCTLGEDDVIVLERIGGNGFSIPAYLRRSSENIRAINTTIHYGDMVMLEGVKLNVAGVDIFLGEKVSLISKAISDVYNDNIDFQKKTNLYVHRHLQLIREQAMVLHFRKCSSALRAIRQFLYARGYEEVNTTMLQQSFEAGLADPFVTRAADHDKDMFLKLTSELLLWRLMIGGFSKVFEIGKSFRNQCATANLLPQFTILELYSAYAGNEEMESLSHNMVCEVLIQLYGSVSIPTVEGLLDCSGAWHSCDFADEVEKLTGLRYDESLPIEELARILDKAGIVRPAKLNRYSMAVELYSHVMSCIRKPTFLRNLPAAQSPLYRLNDDGSTVDETLLIINGKPIVTIVNPERDPTVLRRRMEDQLQYRKDGQSRGINEDVINAVKFGLPPCRGIAVGIEHLLMLLLNTKNIRDVELFPVF